MALEKEYEFRGEVLQGSYWRIGDMKTLSSGQLRVVFNMYLSKEARDKNVDNFIRADDCGVRAFYLTAQEVASLDIPDKTDNQKKQAIYTFVKTYKEQPEPLLNENGQVTDVPGNLYFRDGNGDVVIMSQEGVYTRNGEVIEPSGLVPLGDERVPFFAQAADV